MTMVKIVPVLYCSTICLDCFRLYRTTENVLVQSYLFRPGTRLPIPSWYTVTCSVLVHGYLFRPGTRLPVPSWYTVTCSVLILVHSYRYCPCTQLSAYLCRAGDLPDEARHPLLDGGHYAAPPHILSPLYQSTNTLKKHAS